MTSLMKVKRKIKRLGKSAVQFRISSTFEFVELECQGTWRPEKLRVIWLRNHRRVKSNDTTMVVTEDFGPNGAKGKAIFNPAIAVSLLVTLYRDSNHTDFEEKEYKYMIESESESGKKILATFNCNVAEFVGIPSTKQALDLNLKCVSKKVKAVKLGITLECTFMKEGKAMDDDMQSTFSAMSTGVESITYDEEDDDETDGNVGGATREAADISPVGSVASNNANGGNRDRLNTLLEESETVSDMPLIKETVLDSPRNSPPVSLARADQAASTAASSSPSRKAIEPKETHVPPSNPYLEEEEEEETMAEDQPKKLSPTSKWIDSSVVFVDCFEEVMGREKLDSADVIGLYFSAGWCPPCRRFLPKLVKFYHHLKQHGKSFELIYISSDYSKQDMMKYMKEQQMPWMGVEYEGEASDNFRKTYKVSAVPLLKILGTRGYVIEESAKKSIEGASNGSAILKLYNKWHEQLEDTRVTKGSKKGLLSKIKKSKEESDETLTDGASLSSESTERVSLNSRQRSKGSKITNEKLEEKEEKIQHLEEVNKVLKQANDDMREEIEDLRAKLSTVSTEMEELRTESSRLQDESKQMVNNLNMRGWLFKRGIKGLTANRWRPRYFRLDEGSKLYYYKNSTEGTPQGFIDLEKVLSVQEVSPAQQDKNHATFNIQCDGRTFQMQAHDEPSMRRWMEAILYITEWRKRNSTVSQSRNGARP